MYHSGNRSIIQIRTLIEDIIDDVYEQSQTQLQDEADCQY
jgi:hypothetical protein